MGLCRCSACSDSARACSKSCTSSVQVVWLRAWLPGEALSTDMQEGVGMGEGLAQEVEGFAEIGVRLLLGRVGPEQKGEMSP